MKKQGLTPKIGIIGGGQLGKMMILEAKKMGFYVAILDPSEDCPAHSIADKHIVKAFNDETAIRQLSSAVDVLTYEFEHIDAGILLNLENENVCIYPSPKSLQMIQNKFTQKLALSQKNLPLPQFMAIKEKTTLGEAGNKFGYPFILKSCTGGYDGKGNFVIHHPGEIDLAYEALGSGKLPLMAEQYIPYLMEISVLACRSIDGHTEVYPVAKNTHKDNILEETLVPAPIANDTARKAMAISQAVMEVFAGVGMFCIELFLNEDGNLLINEVAPRPHNSGHYTIEACITSQFEQHIRAITGLPLGSPALIKPAAMRNLLGSEDHLGPACVIGLENALNIKGAAVHIYGKSKTVPKRKMGHITVIADSVEEAATLCKTAYEKIQIQSLRTD